MILGALLVAAHASAAPSLPANKVFGCQYFRTKSEASDPWVHQVDLQLTHRSNGSWTISGEKVVAQAYEFPARFNSVGGSAGLRWRDGAGAEKTAYIAFADMKSPDGVEFLWLSFDRPSLWQAPGYGCQTAGTSGGAA